MMTSNSERASGQTRFCWRWRLAAAAAAAASGRPRFCWRWWSEVAAGRAGGDGGSRARGGARHKCCRCSRSWPMARAATQRNTHTGELANNVPSLGQAVWPNATHKASGRAFESDARRPRQVSLASSCCEVHCTEVLCLSRVCHTHASRVCLRGGPIRTASRQRGRERERWLEIAVAARLL